MALYLSLDIFYRFFKAATAFVGFRLPTNTCRRTAQKTKLISLNKFTRPQKHGNYTTAI